MEQPIVKSESRARQGPKGRPVLYVLVGSLVLLGVYMVGLMTWSSRQPADYATRDPASTTGSTSTNAPSSANASRVPAGNPAYPAPSTPTASAPAPTGPATPVTPTPTR